MDNVSCVSQGKCLTLSSCSLSCFPAPLGNRVVSPDLVRKLEIQQSSATALVGRVLGRQPVLGGFAGDGAGGTDRNKPSAPLARGVRRVAARYRLSKQPK